MQPRRNKHQGIEMAKSGAKKVKQKAATLLSKRSSKKDISDNKISNYKDSSIDGNDSKNGRDGKNFEKSIQEIKGDNFREQLESVISNFRERSKKIAYDIHKYTQEVTKTYIPYVEQSRYDNPTDFTEARAKQAEEHNKEIYIKNQTQAWGGHETLERLDGHRITHNSLFQGLRQSILDQQTSVIGGQAIRSIAANCENLSKQAQLQMKAVDERAKETEDYLKGNKPAQGGIFRRWQGDIVQRQALERASKIEAFLHDVQKHRQETQEGMGILLTQTEQRLTAVARKLTEAAGRLQKLEIESATAEEINKAKNDISALETEKQKITQEKTDLGSLIEKQKDLEKALDEALAKEKKAAKSIEDALQAITEKKAASERQTKENNAKQMVRDAADAEAKLRKAFEVSEAYEMKAANILKNNPIYTEEVGGNRNQLKEKIKEIRQSYSHQDAKDLTRALRAHLPIDVNQGKFTIGGVWMEVKEVEGFAYDATTGNTIVKFRPDVATIKLMSLSRDNAKTVREQIYTKRLQKMDIYTEKDQFSLEIPGDSFDGNGRKNAKLVIRNEKGHKVKEYTDIDMTRLKSITVSEHTLNEKMPIQLTTEVIQETMPDNKISSDAVKSGSGYGPSDVRSQWRFNLDETGTLHFPNGKKIENILEIDFTETNFTSYGETIIKYKGGAARSLSLNQAGSNYLFPQEIKAVENDLKSQMRERGEASLDILEKVAETGDKDLLLETIAAIEMDDNIMAASIQIMEDPLKRAPRNRYEMNTLRKDVLKEQDVPTFQVMEDHIHGIEEMYEAGNELGKKWQQSARDIYKKDPSNSKLKQELLQKIYMAEHLLEKLHFPIVDNPDIAEAAFKKVVEDAGKAARHIAEATGKSSKEAQAAQSKAEEKVTTIFKNAFNALEVNEKNREEKHIFSIKSAVYFARIEQAKANAVLAKLELAKLTGETDDERDAKKENIDKAKLESVKDTTETILEESIKLAQKASEDKMLRHGKIQEKEEVTIETVDGKQSTKKTTIKERVDYKKDEIGEELRNIQEQINNVAAEAKKISINKGDTEIEQCRAVAIAVTEEAAKLVNQGRDAAIAHNNIASAIADTKKRLDDDQNTAETEAEKRWGEEENYSHFIEESIAKKLEMRVDTAKKEAKAAHLTEAEQEIAGVKAAFHFATIEQEKLTSALTQKSILESQGLDKATIQKRMLDEVRKIEQSAGAGRDEAATLAAIQEAIRQRQWAGMVKDMSTAAQKAAAAAGKTVEQQNTAVNEANRALTKYTNDAANSVSGDNHVKEAARLEATKKYVAAQEHIAKYANDAANAASSRAKDAGKTPDEQKMAGYRAAQVVCTLADIAQKSAGTGGDGLGFAVTAAAKAANDEIALAEDQKQAMASAQQAATLAGRDLNEATHNVTHAFEATITAAGTTAITDSRSKARHAAQKYAQLAGEDPHNVVHDAEKSINDKIAEIDATITPATISDIAVREAVTKTVKATVAARWAMVEQAKLDVATLTLEISKRGGITNVDELKDSVREGIDYVEDYIRQATQGKETVEASFSAAVAAREMVILHQSILKSSKAAQSIESSIGNNSTVQKHAFEYAGKTVLTKFNIDGLAAAVHYAAAQEKIAQATEQAYTFERNPLQKTHTAKAVCDAAIQAYKENISDPIKQNEKAAAVAARKSAEIRGEDQNTAGNKAIQFIKNEVNTANAIKNTLSSRKELKIDRSWQVDASAHFSTIEAQITQIVTDAAGNARNRAKLEGKDSREEERAAIKAAQSILEGVDQARSKELGSKEIKDRVAIETAKKLVIEQAMKIPGNRKGVEQAAIAARAAVKETAAEARQHIMRTAEATRNEALQRNPDDADAAHAQAIAAAEQANNAYKAKIKEDVQKSIREICKAAGGDEASQLAAAEVALNKVCTDAEGIMVRTGGDEIEKQAAGSAAAAAYAASQGEIAKAASSAAKDARRAKKLAGLTDEQRRAGITLTQAIDIAGQEAAKDVRARADTQYMRAAREGHSIIEQHAFAATTAAQFAAATAELALATKYAYEAGKTIAKLKRLPSTDNTGGASQESEAQKAATEIIMGAENQRVNAANAIVEKATIDATIDRSYIIKAIGENISDADRDRLAPKDVINDAMNAVEHDPRMVGRSRAAIAEAKAEAAATAAATEHALKEIAHRVEIAAIGVDRVEKYNRARRSINVVRGKIFDVRKETADAGKGPESQNAAAAEAAMHEVTHWQAIATIAKATYALAQLRNPLIDIKDAQNSDALLRDIDTEIRNTLIRTYYVYDHVKGATQHEGSLTAARRAAEVATQLAAVDTARCAVAEAARETAQLAGLPLDAAEGTQSQVTVINDAVGALDARNALYIYIPENLPGNPTEQQRRTNAEGILRYAALDVPVALREAAVQAKILAEVRRAYEAAYEASGIAQRPRNQKIADGQAAAERVRQAAETARNNAEDVDVDAIQAAMQYAESEFQITKAIKYATKDRDLEPSTAAENILRRVQDVRDNASADTNLAIAAARAAAQAAENHLHERTLDHDDAGSLAKANKAEKAIQDLGTTRRNAEAQRFLDDIATIAHHPAVRKAMLDVATDAAATAELAGKDEATMLQESMAAVQAVERAAVTAMRNAHAAAMDKDAQETAITGAVLAVTARYASRYTVAASTREMAEPRGVERISTQNKEVSKAIQDLDWLIITSAGGADTDLQEQAKKDIIKSYKVLGRDANEQTVAANQWDQMATIAYKNEIKAIKAAGGDTVRQSLGASNALRSLAAIERCVSDTIKDIMAAPPLHGKNNEKKAMAIKFEQDVRKAIEDAQDRVANDGGSPTEQRAAGVAAAMEMAMHEKSRLAVQQIMVEQSQKVAHLDAKQDIKDTADHASNKAKNDGKGILEQNIAYASAATKRATQLIGGSEAEQTYAALKAKEKVAKAARSALSAINTAGSDTAIQAADHAARYATAQAKIAQAMAAVADHIHKQADQLITANADGNLPIPPEETETPGDEEHRARAIKIATHLATHNLMDMVTATRTAVSKDTDQIIAWERAAAKATAYAKDLGKNTTAGIEEDTETQHTSASTESAALAARARHYATLVAAKGDVINTSEQGESSLASEAIKTAKIAKAQEIAALLARQDAGTAGKDENAQIAAVTDAINSVKYTADTAQNASKTEGKNSLEQADAAVTFATKDVMARYTVTKETERVSDTIQVIAKDLGLDDTKIKEISTKFAQEVMETASAKRNLVLKTALTDVINREVSNVQKKADSSHDMHALSFPDGTTIQAYVNGASDRIQTAANHVFNAPATTNRDIVTRHQEAAAAAAAQGAIEKTFLTVLEDWRAQKVALGKNIDAAEVESLQEWVTNTATQARDQAHEAGLHSVQQEAAVAAAVTHFATNITQISQSIIDTAKNISIDEAIDIDNGFINDINKLQTINVNVSQVALSYAAFAKKEASKLAGNSKEEYKYVYEDALEESMKAGNKADKDVKKYAEEVRNKAEEAYTDGAKQQAEVGIALGKALKSLEAPTKEAELATGIRPSNLTSNFGTRLIEFDKQASQEAQSLGKDLDGRMQARITALAHARDVLAQVATALKDTANATQFTALASLEDRRASQARVIKEAGALIETFNNRFKAAHGDLATKLAAAGEAVVQFAEGAVAIKRSVEALSQQVQESINRAGGSKEQQDQASKEAVRSLLEQVDKAKADAKAANKVLSVQDLASIAAKAAPQAIADTTSSDAAIEKALADTIKECTVLPTVKISDPTALQLLREADKYIGKANMTDAERHYLQQIDSFINNPANQVHYYHRNYFNFKQAAAASEALDYQGAMSYLKRLEQGELPSTIDSLESYRQAFEYWRVRYVLNGLARANEQQIPEIIQFASAQAKYLQDMKDLNLQIIEKVLDKNIPPQEANKLLDNMHIDLEPWSKLQESYKNSLLGKDEQNKKDIDKPATLEEMAEKSDAQMAKETGDIQAQMLQQAHKMVQDLIHSTDDPILQNIYRENALKMVMKVNKFQNELYRQRDQIKVKIQMIEMSVDILNDQRMQDFLFTMAIFTFQQGPRLGGDGLRKFFDDIFKIAKSLG